MKHLIVVADPLKAALDEGRPAVALETSVLSHGLPDPWNLRAAEAMTEAVRAEGAEPAWVWVDRGSVRVGPGPDDIRSVTGGAAAKVARRDLPMALAAGGLGGTTVSATLWSAHRLGIEMVATGGIGGVHPGSGDVSADLLELARTPATLVCSGPKSILDPQATLERLEELGVGVLGYRCDELPFFLARGTGLALEHRAEDPAGVADVVRARRELGVSGSLVVCNPVPAESALSADEVAEAVGRCRKQAEARALRGKDVTPFLLACLAEETDGASLEANLALLVANARLAARVAETLA